MDKGGKSSLSGILEHEIHGHTGCGVNRMSMSSRNRGRKRYILL